MRSLCIRARCILIHNVLELGKIRVSKVHRKLRSLVNRSRIRPLAIAKAHVMRWMTFGQLEKTRPLFGSYAL